VAAAGGRERPRRCAGCEAPLDSLQRYCLRCGQRAGPPGALLAEVQRRIRERQHVTTSSASSAPSARQADAARKAWPSGAAGLRERFSPDALIAGLSQARLPSPPVSTLLVLAFTGFGVLLGSVAGSPVSDSLAASARTPVKLLLPAATTSDQSTGAPSSAKEPPAAAAEETPEAAPESTHASTASTPTPAPAEPKPAGHAKGGKGGATSPAQRVGLPAVKHVFLIVLSDQPYAATFGPESPAPYLSRTLESRGLLLARYYAVAHEQLANAIALVSGQGPTPATSANCPVYASISPATVVGEGQLSGDGCVYPATTATLAGELEVKHLTWRAYVQGIDEPPGSEPACAHPALGQADTAVGPYATFRNPFVYFQSLTESPSCAEDDVGLSALSGDLSDASRTPSLSYIVPDRCHDGSPGPCPGGGPGGLPAADAVLQQIVPKILASPAYKRGGLLLITTDEAPSNGEFADSSSCCGQPRYPNLPPATGVAASLPPEGGGQVGALVLSPFVKAHAVSQQPYNHYALLRTIEDLFGLKHLGYAGGSHVTALAPSLFSAAPKQ
jgi:phosphatidylinositol-3-phosphatase